MKILGVHDDATKQQLATCVEQEAGARGVLCADGHLGYSMPIGGVVAYKRHIPPAGVGFDIACGNMAVRTPLLAADLAHDWARLADEIHAKVDFGVGRWNQEPVDHAVLEQIATADVVEQRRYAKLAADQLGTVGSGNHYVDVFEDADGCVWVGVHFGSRGFGHKTATGFLHIAGGGTFDDGPGEGAMTSAPKLLDLNVESGQAYVTAMTLAGEYAYAGREVVVAKVLRILGTHALDTVHNHHNFAWEEVHDDEAYWVVRKGATPAQPGQRGFVGGSMGDISVILQGVDSALSRELLYSTVHGAGRVMSRTKAAGKTRRISRWKCQNYRKCTYTAAKGGYFKDENGPTPKCPQCGGKLRLTPMTEQVSAGLVDFAAEREKVRAYGVELRGAGADEAPPVYRRLQDVLDAHAGTVEVLHVLRPRVVVMAGGDVYDPYRD